MCLSNIYAEKDGKRELLYTNAATVQQKGNVLVCSNILGIPTEIQGVIRSVDLMENIIVIDRNETQEEQ